MSDSDNDTDKKRESLSEILSPLKDQSSEVSEESSSSDSSSEDSNIGSSKHDAVADQGSPKISRWSLESFIKPHPLQNDNQNNMNEQVQKQWDDEKVSHTLSSHASPDQSNFCKQEGSTVKTKTETVPHLMSTKNLTKKQYDKYLEHNDVKQTSKQPMSQISHEELEPVESDDISTVLAEANELRTIKPISSLSSDSDEKGLKVPRNTDISTKKIKRKSKVFSKLRENGESSDEEALSSSNISAISKIKEKKGRGRPRKQTAIDSKKLVQAPVHNSVTESDNTKRGAAIKSSSSRKEQTKKVGRRRTSKQEQIKSRETVETSDSSSVDEEMSNQKSSTSCHISHKTASLGTLVNQSPQENDVKSGSEDTERR